MSVVDLDDPDDPRLGYGFPSPSAKGEPADYVVYAETRLPADGRATPRQGTAFSNIDYAIYLRHRREHGAGCWSRAPTRCRSRAGRTRRSPRSATGRSRS